MSGRFAAAKQGVRNCITFVSERESRSGSLIVTVSTLFPNNPQYAWFSNQQEQVCRREEKARPMGREAVRKIPEEKGAEETNRQFFLQDG
jgi:hypothetical protein